MEQGISDAERVDRLAEAWTIGRLSPGRGNIPAFLHARAVAARDE